MSRQILFLGGITVVSGVVMVSLGYFTLQNLTSDTSLNLGLVISFLVALLTFFAALLTKWDKLFGTIAAYITLVLAIGGFLFLVGALLVSPTPSVLLPFLVLFVTSTVLSYAFWQSVEK